MRADPSNSCQETRPLSRVTPLPYVKQEMATIPTRPTCLARFFFFLNDNARLRFRG